MVEGELIRLPSPPPIMTVLGAEVTAGNFEPNLEATARNRSDPGQRVAVAKSQGAEARNRSDPDR
jgi:hypothetical protein